jgi:hypothetical protein
LNAGRVEYVLVGGHAVAYHGYPRYTGDTDFLVRAGDENARRIIEVLDAFGFRDAGIEIEDLTTPGKIIELGRPPHRIDLITQIDGVTFDEVWATHQTADFDGISVPVIGREALLANKRAAGRAKDLADVDALEPREE